MNFKLVIIGLIAVAVAVAIGIGIFSGSEPEGPVGTYVDEDYVPTRPDVQAKPNTFKVMTPEEKVAAEEAARIAAEQEALSATTTASSTATSTEESADQDTQEESAD